MSVKSAVERANLSFRAGLHAACHALVNVVPLKAACNYSDIAPECPNPQEQRYFPARILLYDRHPGGTGISAKVSESKFSRFIKFYLLNWDNILFADPSVLY